MTRKSLGVLIVRTLVAASLLMGVNGSAQAGAFVGTNLGFTYYTPEGDDGISVFSIPNQSVFLVTFQPALRIGGFVGEGQRHAIYGDVGFWLVSSDGTSLNSAQLMFAYQHSLMEGAVSPIINLGIGVLHIGDDGESTNAPVIGAGIGVRRTLAHGHGAVRGELRFDRQFEAKENGFVVLPSINAIGIEVGFDLYL